MRELGDYGILEADEAGYPETDAAIVALCARLARYGVAPRNLRAIRTGIDREAALIEADRRAVAQVTQPGAPPGGLEELETLAGLTLELSQALFWRSLRGVVARA